VPASCVTVTVCDTTGDPDVDVNVTVALRAIGLKFSATVHVDSPSPRVALEPRLSHDVSDDTEDHDVFDDTDTTRVPPAADTVHESGDTERYGPAACVTVTVRVTTGVPDVDVNVTVADLSDTDEFAAAHNVTEPSPLPTAVSTGNHA